MIHKEGHICHHLTRYRPANPKQREPCTARPPARRRPRSLYGDLFAGRVSDDGVSNSNSGDSTDVYAWGGTPVLTTQAEKTDEWKLTLIESLNAEVLKTVYGDSNVTVDTTGKKITVKAGAAQLASSVYVIDMLLKGGALKRVVIPVGSLSDVGEIVYKDDEPIGYEITIKGADDGTGYTHYEYIQLPSA